MPSIPGIRDSRVAAHTKALEDMDRGGLFEALVLTSAMVGNFLARTWDSSYDVERTHAYLRILTDRQLGLLDSFKKAAGDKPGPITDGMGSASAAAAFGAKEFTQQDPRQWELTWHHQSGGNARPEHADLDGTTVDANIGFDADPGIGAPGCACVVEPTNPKGATVGPMSTPQQVESWQKRTFRGWWGKLTDQQRWAIGNYQGSGFRQMNRFLRDGTAVEDLTPQLRSWLVRDVDEMTSALEKSSLKTELTAFRHGDLPEGLKVGDTFVDRGFVSTSVRATGYDHMEIRIPAGFHAAANPASFLGDNLGEVIIQRGSTFKVVAYDGQKTILEVVPKGRVVETAASRAAAEADAIKNYTFDPYVNEGLRSGGFSSLSAAEQEHALNLKNAIFKTEATKEDMVVYRAVDGDVYNEAVGTVFKDPGFVSTTHDSFLAEDITTELADGKVVEIVIPKGSKVLEITDEMSSFEGMQEVLLPFNSRFLVNEDGTLTFLGRELL